MIPQIDRQPSKSRLVRAFRANKDLTLLECRKDFHGIASTRIGVLGITEDRDGVLAARLDSVDEFGLGLDNAK